MHKLNNHKKMVEHFLIKLVLLLVVVMMCSWGAAEANGGIAKAGCQDECGGVQIPFPFGIGEGCYFIIYDDNIPRDAYRIVCDNTNNPKPLLSILENREVLSISLQDQSILVFSKVAYDCYNTTTSESIPSSIPNVTYGLGDYAEGPILMSTTRNTLTSIGCNTRAFISGATEFDDGCTAYCEYMNITRGEVCDSSQGCCEALLVHKGFFSGHITDLTIHVSIFGSHIGPTCGYAFVAEVGSYNFSTANLNVTAKDCHNIRVPVVYNWFFGISDYETCYAAKADGHRSVRTMCSSNSKFECIENNYDLTASYHILLTCQCLEGYSGNPYLPNGCHQDTNICPAGQLGNGTIASPCIPIPVHSDAKLILGVSIGMGSVISFIILYVLYKLIKRRKEIKKREHNFKRNGGLLLQQEMSTNEGVIDRTKIFSRIELEKATDNFNDNRVLGSGGQGTVYKGMLVDGTIVAVKKSKKVDGNQLAQFINEVVILSQINHRNVVKLFGCCLETDVPLLVYEFIPNGTLYQHIHHPSEDFHMTWKVRLQIAIECAGAVAYLHSSCSSPIYHRDIKSSNILLDEKYKAKVSDFGTSRTISIDKTHVTTHVQGTFGYLDPEFFRSSQFSEKSDVYSFGVVLLELLTSKKPIFTNTFGEPRGLATEFIHMMETSPNQLHEILDTQVLQHCSEEEIYELARLIERCLSMNGKQRPTMREVAMTLETIKSQQDKEGNLVAEQEIRGEERHVWIEGSTNTTNEDPSINSTISLPRCSVNF